MNFRHNDEIQRSAAIPLEARATPAGVIEGLASPFGDPPDMHGTVFEAGAYADSLEEFRKSNRFPAMLWDHNSAAPIGRWDAMEERNDGLHVRGTVNLRTAAGREAYEHLRAGDTTGLSVGFQPLQVVRNRFMKVRLLEVSVVTLPSADRARVSQVRSISSRAELRDILREAGLPRGAAEKLSKGGWPALSNQSIDDIEAERIASEIRSIAAAFKGQ